ncbi:MAG: hypothetical protein ACRESW_03690 [Nevskiales bacterium]
MALWSLFVEVGGKRFSSQVRAASPKAAVSSFLRRGTLAHFSESAASFTAKDIVLFTPMEGLVNMHLCQLGRSGKYVSITLARTVERPQT